MRGRVKKTEEERDTSTEDFSPRQRTTRHGVPHPSPVLTPDVPDR